MKLTFTPLVYWISEPKKEISVCESMQPIWLLNGRHSTDDFVEREMMV